jgi:hypothetical protein
VPASGQLSAVFERKAEARRGPRAKKTDGERDVLAKIAEMPESDRAMAKRLHAIRWWQTPHFNWC